MNVERGQTGQLHDLTVESCWELAATRPVGRLAWQSHEGPHVVPVNFTLDGRGVWLRTAAYSAVARECDDSPVAFEVDDLDEADRSGWSVVFRGRAHFEARGPEGEEPDVWVAGSRALRIRIDVAEVSGRWIHQEG